MTVLPTTGRADDAPKTLTTKHLRRGEKAKSRLAAEHSPARCLGYH